MVVAPVTVPGVVLSVPVALSDGARMMCGGFPERGIHKWIWFPMAKARTPFFPQDKMLHAVE